MKIKIKFKKEGQGMRCARYILPVFFLFFQCGTASAGAWTDAASDIEKALLSAINIYKSGDSEKAMEEVADAYFAIFEKEDANMEIAVRQSLSLKRATALERAFIDIRKMMHGKASFKEVKGKVSGLAAEIKKAANELDRKGVDTGNRQ